MSNTDPNAFERDPIFWTTTKPNYNDVDRQRVRMQGGRRVLEKFPQHGHIGDYDHRLKAPGVRFIYVITHHGNEIAMVLTNGASELDPNASYGQYVKRKARFLGWIPTAGCPVQLLLAGDVTPDHIVDKSLLDGEPCQTGRFDRMHPCPHLLAEKAARTAQHKRDESDRLAAYKDQGEKLIEAQHEQTSALVDAIRGAIAERRGPEEMTAMIEMFREMMRGEKSGKGKGKTEGE